MSVCKGTGRQERTCSCHLQKGEEEFCSLGKADGILGASSMAQPVKNPPAVQEMRVRFLSQEDSLEEGVTTHPSILAWRIPMDRGARWAMVHGVAKSWTQLKRAYTCAHTHTYTHACTHVHVHTHTHVAFLEQLVSRG